METVFNKRLIDRYSESFYNAIVAREQYIYDSYPGCIDQMKMMFSDLNRDLLGKIRILPINWDSEDETDYPHELGEESFNSYIVSLYSAINTYKTKGVGDKNLIDECQFAKINNAHVVENIILSSPVSYFDDFRYSQKPEINILYDINVRLNELIMEGEVTLKQLKDLGFRNRIETTLRNEVCQRFYSPGNSFSRLTNAARQLTSTFNYEAVSEIVDKTKDLTRPIMRDGVQYIFGAGAEVKDGQFVREEMWGKVFYDMGWGHAEDVNILPYKMPPEPDYSKLDYNPVLNKRDWENEGYGTIDVKKRPGYLAWGYSHPTLGYIGDGVGHGSLDYNSGLDLIDISWFQSSDGNYFIRVGLSKEYTGQLQIMIGNWFTNNVGSRNTPWKQATVQIGSDFFNSLPKTGLVRTKVTKRIIY